jgi:hypothetical protein
VNTAVRYDTFSNFEILDPGLLMAIGGGEEGSSVQFNSQSQRASTNGNCPSNSYNNNTCIAPINGSCGYAVNEVCVFVPK